MTILISEVFTLLTSVWETYIVESKSKRNYHKDNLFSIDTTGSDSPELLTTSPYVCVWFQMKHITLSSGLYHEIYFKCLVIMGSKSPRLGKKGQCVVTNSSTRENTILTATLRNMTTRHQSLADSPQLARTVLSASVQILQKLQTQSPWQLLSELEGQVPVHKCVKEWPNF